MQAPKGLRLEVCLGTTDRGTLWRAVHDRGQDRIVRFVDQDLGDEQFKAALTVIAERERPRMAAVVGHGYSGRHYYLEYAVGGRCETLEERWAAAPDWRSRLLLFHRVCEVFPQWADSPIRPLGITARDVVMTRTGNGWYPWLLPCPPVHVPSPRALLEVDRHILTAVPPEVIRGVHADSAARDAFALGTLAAAAAGCVPNEPATDDAVTDQARNALLQPSARSSGIPSFLRTAPAVDTLFRVIERHRHREPGVRPPDATGLAAAVREATDVVALAAGLDDPVQARDVLCLLRPDDGEVFARGVLEAAEISERLGQPDRALALIDEVVEHHPRALPARRARADVLWRLAESAGALRREDPLAGRLLDALEVVKSDPAARADAFRRTGRLHLRWGDVTAAADEFYEAAELDKTDLDSLLMYRDCWVRLGADQNAALVGQEAQRRIGRMVEVGVMSEREGRRWHEQFD